MGSPDSCGSSKRVLDWAHVKHVFVEEGVLSGSYVYVHRRRVSSRVHMGGGTKGRYVAYIYIRVHGMVYIHTQTQEVHI
jgi:hypothetical protein